MTQRTVNAKEFGKAMRVTVPKMVQARGRKVFLIVATKVHGELTIGTHVDTGYLRATIAATTVGVPLPPLPAKPMGHTLRSRQFASLWPRSQAQAAGAIAAAVRGLAKLAFAYGASYAQYDTTGTPQLVRRVRAMIPGFVRDAVRQSQTLSAGEAAD